MGMSQLDLKIELSPSQLLRTDGWLRDFYSKCKSRMSDPIVEGEFLKISSADIYNFLSVIEVTEENRFDRVRLWKYSKERVQELISKKRGQLQKNYYQNQLEILEKAR
jgi:hypothetical protein